MRQTIPVGHRRGARPATGRTPLKDRGRTVRGQRFSHSVVREVARGVGRSPAQVLLRWGIQHGAVVLPKSTHPERIEENGALFDFALDAAAMQKLDALEEGLTTGWDPAQER